MNTRGFSVKSRSSKSKGFSLVEVLISIIILSFGLLGMVGMQAASLQANVEARRQSAAAVLARELAEMMRGNQTVSSNLTAATNPYLGDFSASPLAATTPTYCINVGSTCADATAVANAQMTEWLARVDDALPGARVVICFDSAPYDANGRPQWSCGGAAGDVAVIKIGWSRGTTNRASAASASIERVTGAGATGLPSIIFAITPGSLLT